MRNFKRRLIITAYQMDNEGMVIPAGFCWVVSEWCTDLGFIISLFQFSKGSHTGLEGTSVSLVSIIAHKSEFNQICFFLGLAYY